MKKIKPSTLPGFLELLPNEQIQFDYIKEIIKKNYEKYGFLPLDTPVLEKSEVLLAKGGGETEKQVYKIEKGSTDMCMRFDLTVPLARYVVEHYSKLQFPFRRYQIGKVYRGEKAQRGRFREFYQADIDIIGNNSLSILNDAEIPSIIYSIFTELNIGEFQIMLNNRRLLNGYFNGLGIEDPKYVLRSIDKLKKIGKAGVNEELKRQNINDEKLQKINELIEITGTNDEILKSLDKLESDSEEFKTGLKELKDVIKYIRLFGVDDKNIQIDLSITRGLDYYTGTVYETFLTEHPEIGSICSGGRYDNLASNYTDMQLPGVGISIGLSRLYYQLKAANLLKDYKKSLSEVIILPMEGLIDYAIILSEKLRKQSINTLCYTEIKHKMGKKFKYADELNIPYAIVIGEDEIEQELYSLKDMQTGTQQKMSLEEIVKTIKSI
ncbi:MAG: histidine--tRNA ligase [Tissierellia bacterium]|nr:histidine--tRNA ligase [Tissierellia bacterium]